MPKSFEVKTSTGSYTVQVGRKLLGELLSARPDCIVIIDERLRDRLPSDLAKVISLEASEDQKSLDRMPDIILRMRLFKADRSSHVVAIGGGVIQDIATFVCSIYMRGIGWSYMPTTMLGMADSCIGGKSSINVAGLKNLVGNIYPPQAVVVDTDFVSTLDAGQAVGGMIEAAKICFARGQADFLDYCRIGPTFPLTPERAEALMLQSLSVKRWFIEVDEFDKKERLLLNYGHTFGHAVEAATSFGIPHGLAVGLGVIAANQVAKASGWLDDEGTQAAAAMSSHMIEMIQMAQCAPISPIPLSQVLDKFESDKKHQPANYRIVAPQGRGSLSLVPLPKTAQSRQLIANGISEACQQLGWPVQ